MFNASRMLTHTSGDPIDGTVPWPRCTDRCRPAWSQDGDFSRRPLIESNAHVVSKTTTARDKHSRKSPKGAGFNSPGRVSPGCSNGDDTAAPTGRDSDDGAADFAFCALQ